VAGANGVKYLGDGSGSVATSGADLSSSVARVQAPGSVPAGSTRYYGHTQTGGTYVFDASPSGVGGMLYCNEQGVRSQTIVKDHAADIKRFDATTSRALSDGQFSCSADGGTHLVDQERNTNGEVTKVSVTTMDILGQTSFQSTLTAASQTARNPTIFDLSTDTTLSPTPDNLGRSGLLGSGAGYRYTMDPRYVDQGGLDNAAPSAMVTGGLRVGNHNLSSVEQQFSQLRQTWTQNRPSAADQLDVGGALYTPGTQTQKTEQIHLIGTGQDGLEHFSTAFEATVRYDGNGKLLSYTPNADTVIGFVDAGGHAILGRNGKPMGSYTMRANTTTVVNESTVAADGTWRVSQGDYVRTETGSALAQPITARNTPYTDPLVLDGGTTGVTLSPVGVAFDLDADGTPDSLPVTPPSDPWLVMDINGDGRINNGTELLDLTDSKAPLNLLTQDSNGDGILDSRDEAFGKLQLWADGNWDGHASAQERQSLAEAGIASIDVAHVITGNVAGRTGVKGLTATYADSTSSHPHTAVLWDIPFDDPAAKAGAPVTTATSKSSIVKMVQSTTQGKQAALMAISAAGVSIDLNSVDATSGTKATQAIGASGHDSLTGTADADWLIGGAGSDTFKGGAGADMLVIDADDHLADIDGGSDIDTVVIADERGVLLNLAQTNTEVVYGGYGNDVFIGGGADNYFIDGAAGDDVIIGGSADDVLSGQDGIDNIDGGAGDDLIRGGRGDDRLLGGAGGDVIDGGLGNDSISAGDNGDVVIASGGADTVDAGAGVDIYELRSRLENYKIEKIDGSSYRVTDLRPGAPDGISLISNFEKISFDTGESFVTVDLGSEKPLVVDDQIDVSPDASGKYTIAAASVLAGCGNTQRAQLRS